MKFKKLLSTFFARLVISLGVATVSMAVVLSLVLSRQVGGGYFMTGAILTGVAFLLNLLDKGIELRWTDNLMPAYRVSVKIVLLGLLGAFLYVVTLKFVGAMLILYLLLWLGDVDRRTVGLKIVVGGGLFLYGASFRYPELGMNFIYLSLMMGSGMLSLLYGVQYFRWRDSNADRIVADVVEFAMVVLFLSVMPAALAFAATLPCQGFLRAARATYTTFEVNVAESSEVDMSVLTDLGVVVILLVLLIYIWHKMKNRNRDEQQPLEENAFEMFGQARPLNLEKKTARRYSQSYAGRIIELYHGFLDFMNAQGVPKEPANTPEEFADALNERKLVKTSDIAGFTNLFLQARFSLRAMSKDDYRSARDAYGALRESMTETN